MRPGDREGGRERGPVWKCHLVYSMLTMNWNDIPTACLYITRLVHNQKIKYRYVDSSGVIENYTSLVCTHAFQFKFHEKIGKAWLINIYDVIMMYWMWLALSTIHKFVAGT